MNTLSEKLLNELFQKINSLKRKNENTWNSERKGKENFKKTFLVIPKILSLYQQEFKLNGKATCAPTINNTA